jgi:multidrug efflux pump
VARFFIDRPVFAIVISLFLLLAGTLSLIQLPIAEFPEIALPTVQVNATYVGASSDVVEEAVTVPLDQSINGVTDMLYINSVSGDDGNANIAVTFELERDPDLAAVEVQNRVSQAQSQLPQEVIQQGVTVRKQSPDTLMYFTIHSPDSTYDRLFINNYAYVYIVDRLKRVKGIGDARVFGAEFGMRIWLKPDKMASLHLTAGDIARVIREQNVQAPAGQIGQPPSSPDQSFQYSVRVRGRLVDVDEFERVIVGSKPDGSFIRLRDVARVELGARDYNYFTELEGHPAVMMALSLVPGANALETAKLVHAELDRIRAGFPVGLELKVLYDTSEFVKASIEEVVRTFVEALILVLIVVFLFLQSWRATLIPMLAVPVSLVATFAAFEFLGFSINTLSLFGMVLAIGIVVDDAIVVVEAVEHNMQTQGLSPKEATRVAMDNVQGPVVAIALILAAVFVPMAFIPGVTGQLYKQFAITVAVSTMFSALVALTLTPALCAILLKPHEPGGRRGGPARRILRAIQSPVRPAEPPLRADRGARRASGPCRARSPRRRDRTDRGLERITATGFVPDEDKGAVFMQIILPDAASQNRTVAVARNVQQIARQVPGVDTVVTVVGFDLISGTSASNAAFVIVPLKPWDERPGRNSTRARSCFSSRWRRASLPQAIAIPFNPPALPGFGQVSGFSFHAAGAGGPDGRTTSRQSQASSSRRAEAARDRAHRDDVLGQLRRTTACRSTAKRSRSSASGQRRSSRRSRRSWRLPVNDFTRFGRNYKVTMQAESQFPAADHEPVAAFRTQRPGRHGAARHADDRHAVDRRTLSCTRSTCTARRVQRLAVAERELGRRDHALEEVGYAGAADGVRLRVDRQSRAGDRGRQRVDDRARAVDRRGVPVSRGAVRSWAVPFAVSARDAVRIPCALMALKTIGIPFNVYGQIGLVTLIGLSAKNAILIVEFAKLNREKGMPLVDVRTRRCATAPSADPDDVARVHSRRRAAGDRVGAGAASKVSVGVTVFGGMLAATVLHDARGAGVSTCSCRAAERLSGAPTAASAAVGSGSPDGHRRCAGVVLRSERGQLRPHRSTARVDARLARSAHWAAATITLAGCVGPNYKRPTTWCRSRSTARVSSRRPQESYRRRRLGPGLQRSRARRMDPHRNREQPRPADRGRARREFRAQHHDGAQRARPLRSAAGADLPEPAGRRGLASTPPDSRCAGRSTCSAGCDAATRPRARSCSRRRTARAA